MSKPRVYATDPDTGETFMRQTERVYTVCRVERLDALTAEEYAADARAAYAITQDRYVLECEATARIIAAWTAGQTAPAADLEALQEVKTYGGGNSYTSRCTNKLEQLTIEHQRALAPGDALNDFYTEARFLEFAANARKRAADAREPRPPAEPWRLVSWHHSLGLAQKVQQRNPDTTVTYLKVRGVVER